MKNVSQPRTAIFPGSFDPFTAGHLEIVERSLGFFDRIIIAIGRNSEKRGHYNCAQREDIIRQAMRAADIPEDRYDVIIYDALTATLCEETGIYHIIRGIRSTIDFEYERSIADANKHLNDKIDTIFIASSQRYSHISSTAVRDLIKYGGDLGDFMPKGVVLPETAKDRLTGSADSGKGAKG